MFTNRLLNARGTGNNFLGASTVEATLKKVLPALSILAVPVYLN